MKKVTDTSKNPHLDWLMGGNPRAIEAQEAQGQKELVQSSQLPRKLNGGGISQKDAYEEYIKMGIDITEDAKADSDPLFIAVTLPEGWKVESTDHSMWNLLKDNKGRKRGSIFYKAAFYDRDSFINLECCYQAEYKPTGEKDEQGCSYHYYVAINQNTGQEVFRSETLGGVFSSEKTYGAVKNWLNENFPDYKDPHAYWE